MNGVHKITSFEDFTEIAVEFGVGIYVETKNSTDFNEWLSAENKDENTVHNSLTFEQILFEEMGVHFIDSGLPIIYQSFQLESIVRLKNKNEYENSEFTFLSTTWPNQGDLEIMEKNGIHGLGIWKDRIVEVDSETRRLKRKTNGEVSFRPEGHHGDQEVRPEDDEDFRCPRGRSAQQVPVEQGCPSRAQTCSRSFAQKAQRGRGGLREAVHTRNPRRRRQLQGSANQEG